MLPKSAGPAVIAGRSGPGYVAGYLAAAKPPGIRPAAGLCWQNSGRRAVRRSRLGKGSEVVRQLTNEDYENLLAFRTSLRRFQHWSQGKAREVGITPAQHQLLLAVKGHRDRRGPTIGELADYLLLRHHSAVELVDRAEQAGLVERWGDEGDGRIIRVRLTTDGNRRLTRLTPAHLDELEQLAPVLEQLVAQWRSPEHP